jgi:hypothetical protein
MLGNLLQRQRELQIEDFKKQKEEKEKRCRLERQKASRR